MLLDAAVVGGEVVVADVDVVPPWVAELAVFEAVVELSGRDEVDVVGDVAAGDEPPHADAMPTIDSAPQSRRPERRCATCLAKGTEGRTRRRRARLQRFIFECIPAKSSRVHTRMDPVHRWIIARTSNTGKLLTSQKVTGLGADRFLIFAVSFRACGPGPDPACMPTVHVERSARVLDICTDHTKGSGFAASMDRRQAPRPHGLGCRDAAGCRSWDLEQLIAGLGLGAQRLSKWRRLRSPGSRISLSGPDPVGTSSAGWRCAELRIPASGPPRCVREWSDGCFNASREFRNCCGDGCVLCHRAQHRIGWSRCRNKCSARIRIMQCTGFWFRR